MNPLLLTLALFSADKVEKIDKIDVPIDNTTEETSYAIAKLLMDCVKWVLKFVGLEHNSTITTAVYAILIFFLALVIGRLVQWLVVFALNKLGKHIHSDLYNYLVSDHFFTRLGRIIPAFVFLILIQFTLMSKASLSFWLTRLTWIYTIYIISDALCALADSIWGHIDSRANKRHLPLNGLVQLVKLVIWVMAIIVIVGILLDKSPGSLIAGLGAFAAVLMLVFKDSILGVVAGVQLAENDSLHVGDWIAVPDTDANGTVREVGLTAIKIENWDKTVSTVPPYSLVSKGFKNFRNMQLSNTRRICRSYMIDADSVVPTSEDMLSAFARIPLMRDWIEKKIEQRKSGKVENVNNSERLADGSIDTNLGVFRAYVKIWLENNPNISAVDTCFVTTLDQTSAGIPLQIYCFTSTSSWLPYEGIQASVFEHIAAMLYRFNLYTFENASGRDEIIDGYLSPGKNPGYVFGVPFPMFYGNDNPLNPGIPPQGLYPASGAQIPGSQPPESPSDSGKSSDASKN